MTEPKPNDIPELSPLFQTNSNPQNYTVHVGLDQRASQPVLFTFDNEEAARQSERGFERARDRAERRWDRNEGGDTSAPSGDKPFSVQKNPSGPGFNVMVAGDPPTRVARYNDEGKANAVANAMNDEHEEQSKEHGDSKSGVWIDPRRRDGESEEDYERRMGGELGDAAG
ncbi:MAG: hypothetical protein AAF467_03845 [Actinomycetota bacterium]